MAEITGRKVFAFTASAFAVIIGVNVVMAYKAISTFPGLEVQSAYVASQNFDADRAAQAALGLRMQQGYDPALRQITLRLTNTSGAPVQLNDLQVLVGRTTEARDDFYPVFAYQDGAYVAQAELTQGKWLLHVSGRAANGAPYHKRLDLLVKG